MIPSFYKSRNKTILLLLVVACLVFSCGNVKDLKFTQDNKEQVLEKVRKSKDLTGEEVGLLMAAMLRTGFTKESLEGKTVGQLIKEQKALRDEAEVKDKEAKRLAEEAKKKEAEMAAQLSQYISVAPYKKSFHKANIHSGDFQDRIDIAFVFENKGTKDIKAFKGTTVFSDLFGTEIYKSGLMNDKGIKAGAKKNWTGTIKYNQFISEQQKFRDTELENTKFEWKPKAIIFSDGSRIGLED
jgi:hypothetical protein